jgi:hypothetical protein
MILLKAFKYAWRRYPLAVMICLGYLGLHFTYVKYRDTILLGFVLSPMPAVFSREQDVLILGYAELETRFGTTPVLPLSVVTSSSHYLRYMYSGKHNFSAAGIPLSGSRLFITFEYNDIVPIATNRKFIIEPYSFRLEHIFVEYVYREKESLRFVMADEYPEKIELSDGTEVHLQKTPNIIMHVQPDTNWEIKGHYDNFFVKHPGETEPREYTSITFEKNWGKFIKGSYTPPMKLPGWPGDPESTIKIPPRRF